MQMVESGSMLKFQTSSKDVRNSENVYSDEPYEVY